MSLDKNTIHALVVGISKYNLKHSDLEGPVPDALLFASWLLNNGIDPKNIRLFLSPTDDTAEECARKAAALGLHYLPANKANLDFYLDKDFPNGTLFILFWSGHGVVDRKNGRYLFFSDATEQALNYHLDVGDTLAFLRGKAFSKQIGFIDTCAKSVGWDLGKSTRPLHGGSAEQSYLFAASPGQAAGDLKTKRTSKFSEQLLEVLAKETFPPRASNVIKEMLSRFANHAEQRPQYFAYKDFDSDESLLGYRPSSEYVQCVASANNIPIQGLRRLADKAALCANLSQCAVRDKLFAELQSHAAEVSLARSDYYRLDPSDDLLQIFAGALDRGLVKALCDSLNKLDAESLPVRRMLSIIPALQHATSLAKSFSVEAALLPLYRTKKSALPISEYDSVAWMIWSLADSIRLLEPVAEFLVRLGSQAEDELHKDLNAWAAQYIDISLIGRISEEPATMPTFLFIDIQRQSSGVEEQDTVEAFLQRGLRTIHSWPARQSRCQEINNVIDAITFEAEKLVRDFFVQILVPLEMFDWSPHSIPIEGEPLGTYFPVALRWRERVHQMPRTRYQEWITRAQEIRQRLTRGCRHDCRWVDVNVKTSDLGEPGLIAFEGPDFCKIQQTIRDGAPFALWPLAQPASVVDLRCSVDNLSAKATNFDKLPHELKEQRFYRSAPDISLFWDDPQQLKSWKLVEP